MSSSVPLTYLDTTLAMDGTELDLVTINVPGEYAPKIDWTVVAAGDLFVLRGYAKFNSGGSAVQFYEKEIQPYMVSLNKGDFPLDWVPNNLTDTGALRWTLQQTLPAAGSFRTVAYSILRKGSGEISSHGLAAAGGAATITLNGTAIATDSYYNNQEVEIISGIGLHQSRRIQSYVGSTKVATIAPNWVTQPDNSSYYEVIKKGRVDVGGWVGSTPATPSVNGVPKVDVSHWLGQALVAVAVNGVPKVDLTYALGTLFTESGAGRLVAGIKNFFDVATPGNTMNTVATAAKLLNYIRLLVRKDSAIGTDAAAEKTEINANVASGGGAYDQVTDSQEALSDTVLKPVTAGRTLLVDAAGAADANLRQVNGDTVRIVRFARALNTEFIGSVIDDISATSFQTDLTGTVDDDVKFGVIIFDPSSSVGRARRPIDSIDYGTGIVTVQVPFDTAPQAGDVFIIV